MYSAPYVAYTQDQSLNIFSLISFLYISLEFSLYYSKYIIQYNKNKTPFR
jgi:hypothetical protein